MSTYEEIQSVPAVGHTTGTATNDYTNNNATTHRQQRDWGNPLAHVATNDPQMNTAAFGGAFQPGLYRPQSKRFGNPAPLGLSAFALTTFVLSLINMNTKGVAAPNIVVAAAFGYGGLVQLLAGMWEMAVGNTFGATALSSYGGFWISFAIILTPGGFDIVEALGGDTASAFLDSFGFFLMGWFIFTTLLLFCTMRSTVMFFLLFFWLDLAFLMLGIGYLHHSGGAPNAACIKAGGVFGILAAFWAWYNAFAGMADSSNRYVFSNHLPTFANERMLITCPSFFVVPVIHFPWSDKGRERRGKVDNSGELAMAEEKV
jgi:succinate-acetate transporter protein